MKLVRESISFKKEQDPVKAMGLGTITVPLDTCVRLTKDRKRIDPEGEDDESVFIDGSVFIDVLRKNHISYKVINPQSSSGWPTIEYTATKRNLIPLLTQFDPYVRSEQELRRRLSKWNGGEDELWNVLNGWEK